MNSNRILENSPRQSWFPLRSRRLSWPLSEQIWIWPLPSDPATPVMCYPSSPTLQTPPTTITPHHLPFTPIRSHSTDPLRSGATVRLCSRPGPGPLPPPPGVALVRCRSLSTSCITHQTSRTVTPTLPPFRRPTSVNPSPQLRCPSRLSGFLCSEWWS